MDTSPEYVKMCEKAEEIQPKMIPFEAYRHTVYFSGNDVWAYPYVGWQDPPSRPVWLPRQDQLQEMLANDVPITGPYDLTKGASCFALFSNFNDFVTRWNGWRGNTPEQLWLAFVMKEKFGKTWNGEEWVA